MLVLWSGLELLRYMLYRTFGFSFQVMDAFDTTIADLTYMRSKAASNAWPATYAQFAWGLSWYYWLVLVIVAISFVYILTLLTFRYCTYETPPSTTWMQLYRELWPLEVHAVFLLGITRCMTLMITHGASFDVFGGVNAQGAEFTKSATWSHLTSHYYLAAFVISSNVLINVLQYVYSKYEEYVVGECFDETTPLEGKVYIVTGANTGLGFHTAAELAHMGATVVMACRTPAKAQAARDLILQGRSNEMRTPKKEMIAPSKVIILPLDLNSFDSVREFVASFKKLQLPLHGLINNAGMMSAERSETSDNSGLETVMTANHLSPFLLTNLLLPELNATAHRELQALRIRKGHESHSGDVAQQSSKSKKAAVGKKSEASVQDSEVRTSSTGPTQADIDACYGRIINVASALHKSTKAFNFDDIMSEKNYSLFGTYAQSKLANVLFTCELQERFDRLSHGKPLDDQILVVANCVHPGCVRTEVTRNMSPLVQLGNNLAAPIMCWFQKTALQGCYTSVFTAISPEAVETDEHGQRGGGYYFHCEKCAMGPGVNATDAKRLWMVSEAYVEQKFM